MAVGFILLLLLLMMVVRAAYTVEHVVGGSACWAPGVDYAKWAAGETFHVHDTLRLNYNALHSVIQVTIEDYNTCTPDHPIAAGGGGSPAFTLTDVGQMFFICPVPGQCVGGGMKLAINVLATSTTTPPTPPSVPDCPTPPSVPGGPTPPSVPCGLTPPSIPDGQTPPSVPGSGMVFSDPCTNPTKEIAPFCGGGNFVATSYINVGVSVVLVTVLGFMVL